MSDWAKEVKPDYSKLPLKYSNEEWDEIKKNTVREFINKVIDELGVTTIYKTDDWFSIDNCPLIWYEDAPISLNGLMYCICLSGQIKRGQDNKKLIINQLDHILNLDRL